MKKIYVLDTNIVLQNANSIFGFKDNIVVIPDVVINELDRKKSSQGEVGYNARLAARYLDDILKHGDIVKGIEINKTEENSGVLRVESNYSFTEDMLKMDTGADTDILGVAKWLGENCKEHVTLVTNDLYLRIKASMANINVEGYRNEESRDFYTGRQTIIVPKEIIDMYFKEKVLFPHQLKKYCKNEILQNQYVLLKSEDGQSSLPLFLNDVGWLVAIHDGRNSRIKPRNLGQTFMYDSLYRHCSLFPLTIIKGPAGTGKTLFALDSALNSLEKGDHKKILYLRGNTKLDEDIGFLPGTEEEKLEWILRPVRDNLETIFESKNSGGNLKTESIESKIEKIMESKIEVTAVAHMRGRSISNAVMIIDEAQNLTPNQVKTLLSRAGEGTKVILMGDPYQIDHPFLDFYTNGLAYASEKMKGSKSTIQVTLFESEVERSTLSAEIFERMENHK